MNNCSCNCKGGSKLIFSCSGAADVGELADKIARNLNGRKVGKMFCIVGVGGCVPGIMKMTSEAEKILAIDGCPLECVKNCLEQAGFKDFVHMKLWELGCVKGQTAVTDELVESLASKANEMLA